MKNRVNKWMILFYVIGLFSCEENQNEVSLLNNLPQTINNEISISLNRKTKKHKSIDWDKIYFSSIKYSDTAKMRPLIGDASTIEVKFNKSHFFNKNYRVFFTPYSKRTFNKIIRYKLADYLGVLHPEISSARLNFEEKPSTFYLMESDVDKYLLERNVVSSSIPFSLCFDLNNANCQGVNSKDSLTQIIVFNKISHALETEGTEVLQNLFDYSEMSRYMLLHSLLNLDPRTIEMNFYYSFTDGKIHPIYRELGVLYKNESDLDFKANIISKLIEDSNFLNEIKWQSESLIQKKSIIRDSLLANLENKQLITIDDFIKTLIDSSIDKFSTFDSILQLWRSDSVNYAKLYLKNYDKERKTNFEDLDYLIDSIGVVQSEKRLLFKSGTSYEISKDVVVPANYLIVIEAGAEIRLAKDVSFLSYSPFEIKGTNEDNVLISALNPKEPFGSFGFIGSEKESCSINFLTVIGGSESRINDVYLSGAFCLYHTDVIMRNTCVKGNFADDGLNIKYGNVLIENCAFEKNFADQVDLDFCTGKVISCSFDNNEGDSNGDGLDVSGSNLNIVNCSFKKFDDKGISTGEYSILNVDSCYFENNNSAIAIKDLSIVHLDNSIFIENQTIGNLYQKKQIFGGGTLNYSNRNQFIGNMSKFKLDSLSKVYLIP